ncbi:MAG: OmpH family outer membrane protein [Chitinophagaceae bacterium]
MKRIFTLIAVVAALSFSTTAGAQKMGYISLENMVGLMPETRKIDSLLERYQADSINPQYAQIVSLYGYKDSVYRDSLKTPIAVRRQIEQELPALEYQIRNWQQIVNQAMENKELELLAPIRQKVYDAIKLVAKEKGYTHVYHKEAFLVAPDGDDMITAVAAKLKVPIPKAVPGGR